LGYRFLISESALLAGAIANQITINQNNSPEMNVALLQFDKLHELGIFSAYRNARLKRNNRGYTYPVDETKLKDLILAPFYWKNISSPEVYSFALFSGILVALTYNYQNKPRSINDLESIRMFGSQFDKTSGALLYETTWAGLSLGAGVGEETFFRGFWQAELDEHFGKKWGLPIAAFTFGILHFYGKDTAERMTNVVLATAGGYYLGWLFEKENHRLSKPIAAHFWWDMIAEGISFLLDPQNNFLKFEIKFKT